MEQVSSYSVRINEYSHIFDSTVKVYRSAVDFFVSVCLKEWNTIGAVKSSNERCNSVERLTVMSKRRPSVKYDFDAGFHKFPSYLRRSAIAHAVGAVSSYRSRLKAWEETPEASRGKKPGLPRAGYCFPVLYKGNMFVEAGKDAARVKVFIRNTWDWIDVSLRRQDVKYIESHCQGMKKMSPSLRRKGKRWYLCFPFTQKVTLSDRGADGSIAGRILSVDLGITNACTCCVMEKDGTVTSRHFLRLGGENDSLSRALGRVRKAQRGGARRMPRLWARANGLNRDISVKTASFIIKKAVENRVDVIVMEHLDLSGRKRGRMKQRLHHWRAKYVQAMVTHKAHALGIRVSTVCAWNTSRLAFDGSGRVLRGRESAKTGGVYSLCEFTNGKVYNCDLNASYNIGARYYIREHTKSLPETAGQRLKAEVPSAVKRSTCTLSTLISLYAVLYASA